MGDIFGTAKNLEQLVYLSQLTQGRSVKLYIEHLRAHNYRNSGAMYWQFNDCCPAISWAALDYTNTPKALFYYTKRFYAPVLVTMRLKAALHNGLSRSVLHPRGIAVVNDSDIAGQANLHCRLLDTAGRIQEEFSEAITMAPYTTIRDIELPDNIAEPAEPHKKIIYLEVENNGQIIAENLILLVPDKYITWSKPQITQNVTQINKRQYRVSLQSDMVVKDVMLATNSTAQFSDNFFDMMPDREYLIGVTFDAPTTNHNDLFTIRHIETTS